MLPDLPRQIRKQEGDFGLEFREWWNRTRLPGNFELKHTRGKGYLPFNAVEDEQLVVGRAAYSTKGILLRVTVGTTGSPDYIGQVGQITWIVVRFPKAFYVISLESFLLEKKNSTRKSLTAARAEAISTLTVSKAP